MSSKNFVILGTEVPKGGSAFLDLEVVKLHTRTPLKVPVIVERSKKDGPVVLLLAGVHGDEVNGVAIVRKLIKKKHNIPKTGTIICIPVFNIFGYLIQTREFPDGRDLNRMFPGNLNGSLAGQFAYLFRTEIAPLVDYVIDFHTGGAELDNIPQIRGVLSEPKTLELAKVFGAPYVINSDYIAKSLRETLHKLGKTVLLFEGGKSKNIDTEVIKHGVNGTLNVLKYLGMLPGKPTEKKQRIITKSKWIRAKYSGLVTIKVKNGSWVKKKDVLGIIQDPFGEFEKKIYAPYDCAVFGINNAPIINKGNALFHVSVEQ
ncbi:succinylglutamate desuccinylase [Polaribacter pacificus]|uniref:Succinylglutamate desuccinylase n=1 Tax=Polaribacter pacificus TaxID=1775173 RepID=A0A917MGM5_9FLAO|nr:succinylglutamate desuccinylase/aspartoacylase family protein [Polaribacter pacificus]GGH00898.1 succinylglutamate desuccinylase [Polaribacter pacificus]